MLRKGQGKKRRAPQAKRQGGMEMSFLVKAEHVGREHEWSESQ